MITMEGSDEASIMQRIQSSFGNCSGSIPKQSNRPSQIAQNLGVESNRRPGIPPASPHSHLTMPKAASQQLGSQNFPIGPTHSRSLSQPPFFSFDNLPPLSPSPYRESPSSSFGERVSGDASMEERASNFQAPPVPMPVGARAHRRSSSDIPIGFTSMGQPFASQLGADKPVQLMKRESKGYMGAKAEGEVEDLFSAYMNLDSMDTINSSSLDDKDMDSRASGTKTNDSSENEVESSIAGNGSSIHGGTSVNSVEKRGKRSATGDIAPSGRHFRSLSMDSFMGNLNFNDESPRLPPSPGVRSGQHSPSDSFDGDTKFSLEFGNGEFSAVEMKKIMANEKLAEIAMADPKRAKRILANRQSAARSKERKLRYIAELEHKVQTLQTEATTLSAQLTLLQRDSSGLTTQNNELRFRLQAMEQQAQLRDALNEALTAEVQRLKIVAKEDRAVHPNSMPQQQLMLNNQMLQSSQFAIYQQNQNQNQQQDSEAPKK